MRTLRIVLLLFIFSVNYVLAQYNVSGRVLDANNGDPLPGVNIVVKNTTQGTITNSNGEYTIQVQDGNAVLVYSFIGYKTHEEVVANRTIINVSLETDIQQLESLVVVAYGNVSARTYSGALSSVSSRTVTESQSSSAVRSLHGSISGLQILTGSGQPGVNPTIRIRGIGSANASSDPLYVLDGVVYDGNISNIDPNSVESITVLKDAASSALYGSRAANGVILITTKGGDLASSDGPSIVLRSRTGFVDRAIKGYEFLDVNEYMEITWEAIRNGVAEDVYRKEGYNSAEEYASAELTKQLAVNPYSIAQPVGTDGRVASNANLLWSTDWEDLLTRRGMRTEHSLSISGGTRASNYYVSGSFLQNDGYVIESNFERFSGAFNYQAEPFSWIKLTTKLGVSETQQNFTPSSGNSFANVITQINSVPSIYPVYQRDAEGKILYDSNNDPLFYFREGIPPGALPNSNAVATTVLNEDYFVRTSINYNLNAVIKFSEWLEADIRYGGQRYLFRANEYINPAYGSGVSYGGLGERGRSSTSTYTFNSLLRFDKDVGEHSINGFLGFETYNYVFDYVETQGRGYPFLGIPELTNTTTPATATSYVLQHRIVSFLSSIRYEYQGKYQAALSLRRDGTSRFYEDNRWGMFYAISGSWNFNQEDIFSDLSWLNDSKLRISYGSTGNEDLGGYFPYVGAYSTGWDLLTHSGILINGLQNLNLTWESNNQINIGLDASVFDDRIKFTLDLYERESVNLLFARPLPPSSGIGSISDNVGKLVNRGIEFDISFTLLRQRDVYWDIGFNFHNFSSIITELPDGEPIDVGTKRWEEGRGQYDYYIREWAGVDPVDGLPVWYKLQEDANGEYVKDANGEYIKTLTKSYEEASEYFIGESSLPHLTGGFDTEFGYKNFRFNMLWAFSYGNKLYNSDYISLLHGGDNLGGQLHKDMLNRWTKEGDITNVPKASTTEDDHNRSSTRYLVDGSYLRLSNLTLNYEVPHSLLNTIGTVSGISIYVTADNILTFAAMSGFDPEQSLSGLADNRSSLGRTVSVGLEVRF